jgi:hypothetical protein
MAALCAYIGEGNNGSFWKRQAEGIRSRANKLCFNGRFYRHRVPLVPGSIPGADEDEQLSLSNPMDINRGMATHGMAVSILREYQKRRDAGGAFAEWFSIDPPFPDGVFGEEKMVAGAYCNGGIMPLVGGELSRAAFDHGFEEYGVRQLHRYEDLTRTNETYLWYFPDGRHSTVESSTSPEATPTDGWGSSAMLYALVEGLAGVVDEEKLFRRVHLSPRWLAAGRDEASVCITYGPSGATFAYTFGHNPLARTVEVSIDGRGDVHLHVLLPRDAHPVRVQWNGRTVPHAAKAVEASMYVDVRVSVTKRGTAVITYR